MNELGPSAGNGPLPTMLLVAVLATVSLLVMGPLVIPLAIGMVVAGRIHLRRGSPRRTGRLLAVVLGTIGWQLLHFLEELSTGLPRALSRLLGLPAWSEARFVAFNLAFLALFLVGAFSLVRGPRLLTWFVSFLAVAETLNGVAHPLLALAAGGYFPGLWTSPGCLVAGLLLLWTLRPSEGELPEAPDEKS